MLLSTKIIRDMNCSSNDGIILTLFGYALPMALVIFVGNSVGFRSKFGSTFYIISGGLVLVWSLMITGYVCEYLDIISLLRVALVNWSLSMIISAVIIETKNRRK